MSIQLYEDSLQPGPSSENSSALVILPNGLQITVEEQQKRIKDAEELEKKLTYITEKVPTRIMNISGSNAGAGSGEFHMYRMARRREQMRLMRIDEQQKEEEAQRDLEERQTKLREQDEARTAKRRAQRQKKKKLKKKSEPLGANQLSAALKLVESDTEREELAVPDLD